MATEKLPQARGTSARLARHGAAKVLDNVAQNLIALGLTLVMLTVVGARYAADDDEVEAAAVAVARSAGQRDLAERYASIKTQANELKVSVVRQIPERWRENAKPFSIGFGIGALIIGASMSLARAPTRAHAVRDVGWAIAAPGFVGTIVLLVLQWRATKAVESALSGGPRADDALEGAGIAAREGVLALAPFLCAGAVLLILAIVLRRREKKAVRARPLGPNAIGSRFCFVLGLVPAIHFAAAVGLAALSRGASIGPSLEPLRNPIVYVTSATLFSFGIALWWSGAVEARRFDKAGVKA